MFSHQNNQNNLNEMTTLTKIKNILNGVKTEKGEKDGKVYLNDPDSTLSDSLGDLSVHRIVEKEKSEKSDKEFLTELGFTVSQILDIKNFMDVPHIQSLLGNGGTTLIGFPFETIREVLNESQFGLSLWKRNRDESWISLNKRPIPDFNIKLFKELGFTVSEILDIQKYISIPDLERYVRNGLIYDFTVEEIRQALSEYRQREQDFKTKCVQ